MQDRIPLYPGRVTMTPVAGQANTFDMVRADDPTQAGTPLNKETLLKDATAALYGLGASAVPDDVLAELGKYKQYWWARRSLQYTEERTLVDSKVFISQNYGITLKVANSISINQNSLEITLDNPENFDISIYNTSKGFRDRLQELLNKAPCYVTGLVDDKAKIYYLPANGSLSNNTSDTATTYTICFYYKNSTTNRAWFGTQSIVQAQVVSTKAVTGPWQYVKSSNRNAYPDSGTQDGYEYEYSGIPLDNAVTAPKIETGSYVGTGKYGASNPNTLTFRFVPKFVFVSSGGTNSSYFLWVQGCNGTSGEYNDHLSVVVVSGNTLSWYNTNNEISQRNIKGVTYYYIAIG